MARLVVEGKTLVVRLSWLERLGALAIGPRASLAAIQSVRRAEDPWRELRGLRAPGTGIPGVVVDLAGTRYTRFVVTCRDEAPEDVVGAIDAARR